jgi:hypothetical protein
MKRCVLPQQSGTYYLIYSANANGGLYEGNTANDLLVTGPVTVTYQLRPPDLAPILLNGPVLGVAGQPCP